MSRYLSTAFVLLALVAAGCGSDHSVTGKPKITVQLNGSEVQAADQPSVRLGFVESGASAELRVEFRNDGNGTAILEIDQPVLEPVDWVWAADPSGSGLSLWPLSSLAIGAAEYDADALLDILKRDNESDASVVLAQAYIRAQLVVAAGGPPAPVEANFAAAEAWFQGYTDRVPFDVDVTSAEGSQAASIAGSLAAYADDLNDNWTFVTGAELGPGDFPLELETDRRRELVYRFAQSDPRDSRPTMITISSNDQFEHEEVRALIAIDEVRAELDVEPPDATFINPSVAQPGFETFTITNTGTGDLVIEEIEFDQANPDYELIPPNKPRSEWRLKARSTETLQFSVRYTPSGDPVGNAVIITSNDAERRKAVTLSVQTRERSVFRISHEDELKGYLDFADVIVGDEKRVVIENEGPSNFVIRSVIMEPVGAAESYSLQLQRPATTPGGEPTPVDGTLSLRGGDAAEIAVTFIGDPDRPVNGTLVIGYTNPTDPAEHRIPVVGGDPAPVLDVAPVGRPLRFTAAEGASAQATLVIGNNGNGPLTINRVFIYDDWYAPAECGGDSDASTHFAAGAAATGAVVEPFSLLAIPVTYQPQDAGGRVAGTTIEQGHGAYLRFEYEDPYPEDPAVTCRFADVPLYGTTDTTPVLPEGIVDYTVTPVVSEGGGTTTYLVHLDAGASTPGDGFNGIFENAYAWYLVSKPAGSKAALNDETVSVTQFVADMVGTYQVALSLYSTGENYVPFYSEEIVVDIEVTAQ